mgnify:CR=1 FL=1
MGREIRRVPLDFDHPLNETWPGFLSPAKFDEMVADKRMPGPKLIDSRRVWDVKALDTAFEALPSKEGTNPWDD